MEYIMEDFPNKMIKIKKWLLSEANHQLSSLAPVERLNPLRS